MMLLGTSGSTPGAPRDRRGGPHGARRGVRHAAVRPGRGGPPPACRDFPARSARAGRRSSLLCRQGVPLHRHLPDHRAGRSEPGRRLGRGAVHAQRAGFPAERITLHGNNKSPKSCNALAARRPHRRGQLHELDLLAELTRGRDGRSRSAPRRARHRSAHPPADQHRAGRHKFGFDVASGAALAAISRAREMRGCASGHPLPRRLAAPRHGVPRRLGRRDGGPLVEVKQEFGVEFEELNVGGGLGIRYLATTARPRSRSSRRR